MASRGYTKMQARAPGPEGWIDRLARLYTPVVADVLDRMGYRAMP